jgi:hypothetical protein
MGPNMQIRVSVFNRAVDQRINAGPPGPGRRFVFSLDLQLDQLDGQNQNGQHVGTYSGVVTVLREPAANDNFYKNRGVLVQYESTYKFEAVAPVQAGEITEQGVLYFGFIGGNLQIVGAKEFAITGGTGPYARARGRITAPGETGGDSTTRLLDIEL